VSKHASPEDCWVVLHGRVYDLTKFVPGLLDLFGMFTIKNGVYDLNNKEVGLFYGLVRNLNLL